MDDTKINKITVAQAIYAYELLLERLNETITTTKVRGFKAAKLQVFGSIIAQFLDHVIKEMKASETDDKYLILTADEVAAKKEIEEELRAKYRR